MLYVFFCVGAHHITDEEVRLWRGIFAVADRLKIDVNELARRYKLSQLSSQNPSNMIGGGVIDPAKSTECSDRREFLYIINYMKMFTLAEW